MADRLPIGPYRTIRLEDGSEVPWYLLPFDKDGHCEAPLTAAQALNDLQLGDYTDLIIFSHGWNNDWNTAVGRYTHFLENYTAKRQESWRYARRFRPMLMGIIWPSAVLVMPWEDGPDMAAASTYDHDAIAQERREVQDIADLISADRRQRFYALIQREDRLTPEEILELAGILLPLYERPEDEVPGPTSKLTPPDIVELWEGLGEQSIRETNPTGGVGFADDHNGNPEVAAFFGIPSPRDIVRSLTVVMMKDRAGVVGANGVGKVLRSALSAGADLCVRLVGHSYGCKVVLSALCHGDPVQVHSVLLLQPAISAFCFASEVPGREGPGGYRVALDRVRQPIVTTFSRHDHPLTHLFHMAVRRRRDLGELAIAGAEDNKFRALGGFGPAGCDTECEVLTMKTPVDEYDLQNNSARILALRADDQIFGHGDVSNLATWWALFNQVKA
jgi:pimeloyl-ACP methyl ester carboxylesterase